MKGEETTGLTETTEMFVDALGRREFEKRHHKDRKTRPAGLVGSALGFLPDDDQNLRRPLPWPRERRNQNEKSICIDDGGCHERRDGAARGRRSK